MSSSAILAASQLQGPNVPVTTLFTRKELVGKGAYGGVYKGIHNQTGTIVALKVIDLDTPDDDISEIQKEVALLSELRDAARHNITLYHGCYIHGTELWIAMDFASGGSIRTLMKSGPIEEKYAALIIREVLVALSFLHHQGIIHRDVKAANILLTQTGRILLCDFGVAAHLQANSKRSTFTGTPLWMAPEVITDGKMYDTKADIWSLGITLYEIATGNPPHFGMEPLRACALIPKQDPPQLEGSGWSLAMKEFLASCLTMEPTERPTADDLSRTKWIKSASKLPMVLLRELIVSYVSWIQSGGQRTSIIILPSSEESSLREDTFELAGQAEEGWDFEVEEEDFGVQLGLGRMEGLGDEPKRAQQQVEAKTLDEKAAQGFARPPKQSQGPPRQQPSHPLLRLFDESTNPYAQPSPKQAQIILPTGTALNTVKPTISLPSFDDLDAAAEEEVDFGFNIGGGYGAFGGGGGGGGGGFGGGGGGFGFGGANAGGSTFGGASTLSSSSSASPFGGAFAAADELMTPATIRGNPFSQSQSQSTSKLGSASSLSSTTFGFGGATSAVGAPASPFMSSDSFSNAGNGSSCHGHYRTTSGGGGGGGSGPSTNSSSTPTEFQFPPNAMDLPAPFSLSSSSSASFPSSYPVSQPVTQSPSLPTISTTAATAAAAGSDGYLNRPFGMGSAASAAGGGAAAAARRRADTAPSQPGGFGFQLGGYPPLGGGIPRSTATATGLASANVNGAGAAGGHLNKLSEGSMTGIPEIGEGVDTLAAGGETPEAGEGGPQGEGEKELYPNPIPNQPFGGLSGNKPFTFGGGRDRGLSAAADLGRPSGMSGSMNGMGLAAQRARAGSEAAGLQAKRAALKITTTTPAIPPFAAAASRSPATIGISSPVTAVPPSHSRGSSHSRTNSSSNLSPLTSLNRPFAVSPSSSSSTLPLQPIPSSSSPRSTHRPHLSQSQTTPVPLVSSHLRTDSTASLLSLSASASTDEGADDEAGEGDSPRPHQRHYRLNRLPLSLDQQQDGGDVTPLAIPPAPLSADAALPTVTLASSSTSSSKGKGVAGVTGVGGGGSAGVAGFPFPAVFTTSPSASPSASPSPLPSPGPPRPHPQLHTATTTTTITTPHSPPPPPAVSRLPPLPSLNYLALSTPVATQSELALTLEGLGRWLEVVGEGLGRVVGGELDGEIGVPLATVEMGVGTGVGGSEGGGVTV
ncbi:hypothetical protein JCM11641_002678 [Rhodosporidiobolus odoratus]